MMQHRKFRMARVVLIMLTGLAVYKPRGLTPYEQRKQDEQGKGITTGESTTDHVQETVQERADGPVRSQTLLRRLNPIPWKGWSSRSRVPCWSCQQKGKGQRPEHRPNNVMRHCAAQNKCARFPSPMEPRATVDWATSL